MSGKPRELYVDTAAEFKSEALRRGCEQHAIGLRCRPPGQPHYGGIIERVLGTMMQTVHELPGTTFANTRERGGYESDARGVDRPGAGAVAFAGGRWIVGASACGATAWAARWMTLTTSSANSSSIPPPRRRPAALRFASCGGRERRLRRWSELRS